MKGIHFPLLYKRLTLSSLKSHFPLCLFPSPCYSDRKPNVRNWVSPGDDFFPLPHHCTKDITIFAFIVTPFFWQSVSLSKWDSLSGLDHVVLFFFLIKKNYLFIFGYAGSFLLHTGFHQLPEFIQTHVHRVGDAIQPSYPMSSPSPPAPNPSQHQRLKFQL